MHLTFLIVAAAIFYGANDTALIISDRGEIHIRISLEQEILPAFSTIKDRGSSNLSHVSDVFGLVTMATGINDARTSLAIPAVLETAQRCALALACFNATDCDDMCAARMFVGSPLCR